jgi:predicted nucleotidyltransferase
MFTKIQGHKILNIYPYGSKVYGTHNENSDNDYIVVCEGFAGLYDQLDDVTFYDEKTFQEAIDRHEISVLECLFLPPNLIIQQTKDFNFELNLNQLRCSFSAKASNSFVKAKKKLTVEKDFNVYIAKKSLFHSLRILIFGIQIAKYGKIIDFSEANSLWKDIKEINADDWNFFKKIFQPIYNKLSSDFRILAPK